MRASGVEPFLALTERFEGAVPHFYLDILGLVTFGHGNLADPWHTCEAMNPPMFWPATGKPATKQEVFDDWRAVKNASHLARSGYRAAALVAKLRMSEGVITSIVQEKMQSNDRVITARIPGFQDFPVEAQVAVHLLAWACGPMFRYPDLIHYLTMDVPDFRLAASMSHINERGNPGVVPRNTAIYYLFLNAARVQESRGDYEEYTYEHDRIVPVAPPVPQNSELEQGSGQVIHDMSSYFETWDSPSNRPTPPPESGTDTTNEESPDSDEP